MSTKIAPTMVVAPTMWAFLGGVFMVHLAIRVAMVALVLCILLKPVTAQTPKPKTGVVKAKSTAPATLPPVHSATWKPEFQYVGISRDEFTAVGLEKLTDAEMDMLVEVVRQSRMAAWTLAEKSYTRYDCGQSQALDKVRVQVDASDNSDSEVVSAFRQEIRGIRDAEIVFDNKDADLILHILAYRDKLKTGAEIGYTAALTITESCHAVLGDQKWDAEFYLTSAVNTNSIAQQLARTLVAGTDDQAFESIRKSHTTLRKLRSPNNN